MIETQMAFYLTHTTTNQDETWYTHSCIGTHHKNKVNVVVNNVVLVKQPQAIHSAISETRRCRAMNLGEVITTSALIIYKQSSHSFNM